MTYSPAPVLDAHCGGAWTLRPLASSGFCATWRAEGPAGALFVKSVPAARADALAAEADGLEAIAATRSIAAPAVAGFWSDDERDCAVLAMEWLDLVAAPRADFGERFGRALGRLHAAAPAEGAGRFGWRRDNRLGATMQSNRWSADGSLDGWIAFVAGERLGAMRERLVARGAPAALAAAIDRVVALLPDLFDDGHVPRPSLVHGDLWSGNWGSLRDGTAVVYDPAVSVSDAEAELAMVELFGAPPRGFWPAYAEVAGVAPGYPRRRPLYQLYHLLNHELLFGGYARPAMDAVERLCAGSRRARP